MIDCSRYIDVRCPKCDAPATLEAHSQIPGSPRYGYETRLFIHETNCECQWTKENKELAVRLKYDPVFRARHYANALKND